MTLGDIIKKYRVDTSSTLADVANLCGITKGYVAMLEKNVNSKTGRPVKPTIETILKVCKGLHLDVDQIFKELDDDYVVTVPPANVGNDSPVGAIINILRDENIEVQMRVFDVICDFLTCNEYNQGRIATYANMLAAKDVDTSSADREVGKIKANFYARYDSAEKSPVPYGVDPEDIDTMTGRPIIDEIKRVQREAEEKKAPAKKQVK